MEPLVYSDLYFYVTQKSHHLRNAVHLHSALLCAIQREASKDIKFPITWQFLKIQQLLLSVGTREGSYFDCSVLPASDTCHSSLLFVWLLFPKMSTFTLTPAKGFFFYFVSPSSLSITLIWKIVVHLINHPPMCRQSLHCCRGRFGSSRISWC